MKKIIGLVVLSILFSVLLEATGSSQAESGKITAEDAAISSAQNWLKLVDGGKYGDAWGRAAEYFKNVVPKENFITSLQAVRKPLGKIVERSLLSATYTKTLPGAPDGEYVVIQFRTEFENKKESIETITPQKEKDGKWRVSGYYVR
jgi:hypothetical protein